MSRIPLNTQISAMDWTDEAVQLFQWLQQFSASDESGAIVIASAATLIARQFPAPLAPDARADIRKLGAEFAALIFEVHAEIAEAEQQRPALYVVGGSNA